jgi:hypothetical protein
MNRKKSLALLSLTILLLGAQSTFAAPKRVNLQTGSVLPAPLGAEAFLQSGTNSIFLTNVLANTADISLQAIDLAGKVSWTRQIDSGSDEIASAMTLDPQGNIWIGGSSAPAPSSESTTLTVGVENPDGVSLDGISGVRPDMNRLTIWKISPQGELLATYVNPLKSIPEVSALSANSSGLSIVGTFEMKGFLISLNSAGVFGKRITIGNGRSSINSVIRQRDGGSYLFGSSAETLGGKTLAGKRDGILLKVSPSGAISSVVRSSASGAVRSWNTADSTILLSGHVTTGRVTEVAVTKFTNNFAPSWTARYPSTGSSIAVSGGGNSYLAFTSRSAIPNVNLWRPTTPGLIVLTFNNKGVVTAAHTFPGVVTPINLQFTRERGVIGLGASADGSISIFTLFSR